MKYIIKPSGSFGVVERGLAKVFREDRDGGERQEVSDYQNTLLPGGSWPHRIFYDTDNRRYDINLKPADLKRIVEALHFQDPVSKKVIETADPGNEWDPFFNHEDLHIEVPNSGLSMDTDNVWGEFWYAAAESEPKKFNINFTTDNELVRKGQLFNLTTSGHNEKEVKKEVQEGKRANLIYAAHIDDYQWMVETLRGLDVQVSSDVKIDALQDLIFVKITTEKDFKTRDGMRTIEKFLLITDMKEEDRGTRAKITQAIGLKIIEKEGKRYSFDGQVLGVSPEEIFVYLSKEDHADIKGLIFERIEEKSSVKK